MQRCQSILLFFCRRCQSIKFEGNKLWCILVGSTSRSSSSHGCHCLIIFAKCFGHAYLFPPCQLEGLICLCLIWYMNYACYDLSTWTKIIKLVVEWTMANHVFHQQNKRLDLINILWIHGYEDNYLCQYFNNICEMVLRITHTWICL